MLPLGRARWSKGVADGLGISRRLAGFRLDKLVTAGLPRTGVESSAGIRKVGRRPKVYEPVAEAIAVHIPERRYEMPADARTEAVLPRTQGESARDAALRVAHRRGETLGGAARERVRPAGCLHGLGSDRTTAVSTPRPDWCCVEPRGGGYGRGHTGDGVRPGAAGRPHVTVRRGVGRTHGRKPVVRT